MSFPRTPRTRRDRRSLRTLDPSYVPPSPPPPSGASVISVHYNEETGHVEWRFDSIILDVVDNPLPYFQIAGFVAADWDGWDENVLFTFFADGEGNPPGPGDLWTALANGVVQTEQGGVVAGAGAMV